MRFFKLKKFTILFCTHVRCNYVFKFEVFEIWIKSSKNKHTSDRHNPEFMQNIYEYFTKNKIKFKKLTIHLLH